MRSITLIIVLTFLAMASALADNISVGQHERTSWNILIFMNADNNLEPDAINDINEMEMIGSTSRARVVVQVSRSPRYDFSNGDWDGTRRFQIIQDTNPLEISSPPLNWARCEQPGVCPTAFEANADNGDWNEAVDFVRWARSTYPAERTALIFWGHGSGWRREVTAPMAKGMAASERSGRRISTRDIGRAMAAITMDGGDPIDVVGFDACNMQMLEIAFELRQYAKILIASQEAEPPSGWPYNRILEQINARENTLPEDLSKIIIQSFSNSFSNTAITLSAIRLANVDDIVGNFESFIRALQSQVDVNMSALRAAYQRAQKFVYADYLDLDHFAELIGERLGGDLSDASKNLRSSIQAATVFNINVGPSVKNARSISFYFPPSHLYDKSYEEISFAQNTAWVEVMDHIFRADSVSRIVRLRELSDPASTFMVRQDILDHEIDRLRTYISREIAISRPDVAVDLMQMLANEAAAERESIMTGRQTRSLAVDLLGGIVRAQRRQAR